MTEFLRSLAQPERIAELGLTGARLLRANDPAKVIYSLTLYERGEGFNRLRINADNLDQPLDINTGAKLDLGSTAKLRTLVSWLDLISAAHASYSALTRAELASLQLHRRDRLGGWVVDHLRANPGASLESTLAAAMQRKYSAGTGQTFYTGGGVHTFENFEARDNNSILTVAEAMRRSVNLVFIRMMREITDHFMYRAPSTTAATAGKCRRPRKGGIPAPLRRSRGQCFPARLLPQISWQDPRRGPRGAARWRQSLAARGGDCAALDLARDAGAGPGALDGALCAAGELHTGGPGRDF